MASSPTPHALPATAGADSRTWAGRLAAMLPFALVVAIGAVAHAIVMFRSPAYDDDEGIYMSQAWSVLEQARLAPRQYTYFYDHPPLGWFTIAGWGWLTGGFSTFGASVNSGRTLMLVAHVLSLALLFGIARRAGAGRRTAAAATLIFALSPFQILFGREVLLDNLAVFWMLLSLFLLLDPRLTPWRAALAGLALGLALLNKEIIGLMMPGMAIVLWPRLAPEQRRLGLAAWAGAALSVAALYPLHALLISEFFPAGSFLDFKGGAHGSLLGGIRYHQSRASDGGILQWSSEFWTAGRIWWRTDPALFAATAAAIPAGLLLWRRSRVAAGCAVMVGVFMLFLARGGAVFDFWLLPVVPLTALVLALAGEALLSSEWRRDRRDALARYAPAIVAVALASVAVIAAVRLPAYARSYDRAFANRPTTAQTEAIAWVKANVPRDNVVVIDNYSFVDLRDAGFTNAQSFWRVDTETDIRDTLLNNDWSRISYVTVTPVMQEALDADKLPLVAQAVANAQLAAEFQRDGTYVRILRVNR